MDPVELRLKNCIPDAPYVSATGMNYDGGSYRAAIHKTMEMLDYTKLRAEQAELRKQGRYIGIGVSPYVEPTAWGSAMAGKNGFPVTYYDSARVIVELDGTITVTTGLHNHGQAHETTLAQVAADALGVRLEDVRYRSNDTAMTPYGSGTFASRCAVVGGGSILRAGRDVKEQLVRMAAHMMEVNPNDVDLYDGRATVKGIPEKSVTVAEIAAFAHLGGMNRPDDVAPELTATRAYDPDETYSNGSIVAVVEVDPETGHVEIKKIVCCEDCGVMLNPMVVAGQMHGAIAQGIGGAMYEELAYNEEGQPQASTLMDYLYPSTTEVPDIDIAHLETPSPNTEGGIKGMGESGNIAAGAAVVNAIADAVSAFGPVEIAKTPVGPNEVLELIDAARSGTAIPA
ncbi:xanthine dehydrogenase family protein molybdopterin-binding subunit [Pseudonocardia sp. H11422]|uniref:xanthine dehydrogenase family protein molybdopterin-binding subunit n=1 Tax=Pseudonocardia sp. H11422 TaxID=2835866 RepID=UPI002930CC3C|nr:molybdopterin cofactor-binding domain-containing protein [Pseudonocardia sp. H11422]